MICYSLLIELAATQASHLESVQSELSASKKDLEVIIMERRIEYNYYYH